VFPTAEGTLCARSLYEVAIDDQTVMSQECSLAEKWLVEGNTWEIAVREEIGTE